ncbi:hypothetical protein EVG20_g9163 [Dentipellis fragilis]|uniref:Uncharacterized protein n=1 Tax=Dentipellis fragilis TaxID=205917 RepID=A0A4Y9Y1B4_9AGAM|nr:hypothetical protein EVG20_g9163 [Dentipellis fragilis]
MRPRCRDSSGITMQIPSFVFPFAILSAFALALLGPGLVFAAPTATVTAPLPDGFDLGEILNLLGVDLVQHINVFITLDTLVTNLVSVNFTGQYSPIPVKNPLPFEITIDHATTDAGVNGTIYSHFDQPFTTFVVPALGTANSGTFGNVTLTQGALASLPIIPLGELDILNADVQVRYVGGGVATINGKLGVPIPLDGIKQTNVSTTYSLAI